jgi:hypothetical protein
MKFLIILLQVTFDFVIAPLSLNYVTEMLRKKGGKEKGGGAGAKQKLVIVDTPEPKKSGGCC